MRCRVRAWVTGGLIACVRFYQQALHGMFGYGSCRFSPTCSQYMIEALQVHGPWKGLCLGFWRILRCNPFCRGGYDPVPPTSQKQGEMNNE
jgi:putative membrane protein insertion efficiency factor